MERKEKREKRGRNINYRRGEEEDLGRREQIRTQESNHYSVSLFSHLYTAIYVYTHLQTLLSLSLFSGATAYARTYLHTYDRTCSNPQMIARIVVAVVEGTWLIRFSRSRSWDTEKEKDGITPQSLPVSARMVYTYVQALNIFRAASGRIITLNSIAWGSESIAQVYP